MGVVTRRGLLLGLAASAAGAGVSARASATTVRSVSLPALVRSSKRIVVVTPLDAESHFEELGRRRRIVTDTRVRLEETIAESEASETELLVRTLGGSVGDLGEHVHGQARLALGETCVVFLLPGPDGLHYVSAMAQGHYPLRRTDEPRLLRSPDLPEILGFEGSAVRALAGQRLGVARDRIRAASEP